MEIEIYWSTLAKQQLKDIALYVAQHFGERIAIMAVIHERQSPKTISDTIHRFIEHHS